MQVGNIDISDDESPNPEQREIAESVLEEVWPQGYADWEGAGHWMFFHPHGKLNLCIVAGKETYQHLRLQQLIFAYVQVRAREQGLDLSGFTLNSQTFLRYLERRGEAV